MNSKVAGYKINTQKSLAFLYTNNERSEKEIETIPFIITSKRTKYIGINLPKETKDLYSENYKTLMKEIKYDTNRWKDIYHVLGIGRINIVKMSILPMAIYRFNAIPTKLPMTFFTELEQKTLKFIWRHKRPQIAKAILRKKNGAGGIRLPGFRLYLQSYSNQNSMVLAQKQTYRSMEQDRSPEINPRTYGQLIYDKGSKNIQWRKDSLFNKWCWENGTATCKRMKSEHSLTPYARETQNASKTYKTLRRKHRHNTLT